MTAVNKSTFQLFTLFTYLSEECIRDHLAFTWGDLRILSKIRLNPSGQLLKGRV